MKDIINEIIAQHKCYSIHTFEMKMRLDKDNIQRYRTILERSFTFNEQKTGRENKYYYGAIKKRYVKPMHLTRSHYYDNWDLFKQGLSEICLLETVITGGGYDRDIVSGYLSIRVNPRKLLGYEIYPYIRVVPSEDIEEIIPKMVSVLEPYGFIENDIKEAIISRLDICTNIKLDTQNMAEKYLHCLRKGGYYLGLNHKYKERSETTHRQEFPKNEMRYTGPVRNRWGGRQELSIYLKKPQMMESNLPYGLDEIRMADGQIRFEYRLFRKKTYYLEGKYGCEMPCDLLCETGTIGDEILKKYMAGLYGTGKILKTGTALRKIAGSRHRPVTKQVMSQIVEETRRADMAAAFCGIPSHKKGNLMKWFNELDLSPITIPDSWEIQWFENPITYFMTRNVNERDLDGLL